VIQRPQGEAHAGDEGGGDEEGPNHRDALAAGSGEGAHPEEPDGGHDGGEERIEGAAGLRVMSEGEGEAIAFDDGRPPMGATEERGGRKFLEHEECDESGEEPEGTPGEDGELRWIEGDPEGQERDQADLDQRVDRAKGERAERGHQGKNDQSANDGGANLGRSAPAVLMMGGVTAAGGYDCHFVYALMYTGRKHSAMRCQSRRTSSSGF